MADDKVGDKLFSNIKSIEMFYIELSVVAQELKAHDHNLYYYDRKKVGEVDFLVDDFESLNVLPLEIKSGKDYSNFRALPKILKDKNYKITKGYIFSNEREIKTLGEITYYPIYFVMFL